MTVYVFGNGNLPFFEFQRFYMTPLQRLVFARPDAWFIVCDFRGVDTLTMEWLKTETSQVSVYHVGDRPRYLPDRFGTRVDQWTLVGGFASDHDRDAAAVNACTHFLAIDFNSDSTRESGTKRNIERCTGLGKTRLA